MRSAACCSSGVDGGGVETQMPRQLLQIPPLAVEHLLVGPDNREGERVESSRTRGSEMPEAISAERARRIQFRRHDGLGAHAARLRENRLPLVGAERAIGARGRHVSRSDPKDVGADAGGRRAPGSGGGTTVAPVTGSGGGTTGPLAAGRTAAAPSRAAPATCPDDWLIVS